MTSDACGPQVWALLLTACVYASSALASEGWNNDRSGASEFRRLLAKDSDRVPLDEELGAFKYHDIADHGLVLHSESIPSCPVDELPGIGRGHIFVICSQAEAIKTCTAAAAQGTGPSRGNGLPMFRVRCVNSTCVDSWSPEVSGCIEDVFLEDPEDKPVDRTCGQPDGSVLETIQPDFLLSVGQGGNVFDCLFGLPNGTKVSAQVNCLAGRLQLDVVMDLAGPPLAEPGEEFECFWDVACRKVEDDPAGDQEGATGYHGSFICLPTGASLAGDAGSASVRECAWSLLLWACSLMLVCILGGWE